MHMCLLKYVNSNMFDAHVPNRGHLTLIPSEMKTLHLILHAPYPPEKQQPRSPQLVAQAGAVRACPLSRRAAVRDEAWRQIRPHRGVRPSKLRLQRQGGGPHRPSAPRCWAPHAARARKPALRRAWRRSAAATCSRQSSVRRSKQPTVCKHCCQPWTCGT